MKSSIPFRNRSSMTHGARGGICGAPIALITLVDENRQWFKSRVGITSTRLAGRFLLRPCHHAAGTVHRAGRDKDDRFAQNPLVTSDPKIRFYAGAPLITPDGHALGTLCVIDKVPRTLRPDQKRALQILSRHVISQLELRATALNWPVPPKSGNASSAIWKSACGTGLRPP